MLAMSLLRWAPKCEWLCPAFIFIFVCEGFFFSSVSFSFSCIFFSGAWGVSWYAPVEIVYRPANAYVAIGAVGDNTRRSCRLRPCTWRWYMICLTTEL